MTITSLLPASEIESARAALEAAESHHTGLIAARDSALAEASARHADLENQFRATGAPEDAAALDAHARTTRTVTRWHAERIATAATELDAARAVAIEADLNWAARAEIQHMRAVRGALPGCAKKLVTAARNASAHASELTAPLVRPELAHDVPHNLLVLAAREAGDAHLVAALSRPRKRGEGLGPVPVDADDLARLAEARASLAAALASVDAALRAGQAVADVEDSLRAELMRSMRRDVHRDVCAAVEAEMTALSSDATYMDLVAGWYLTRGHDRMDRAYTTPDPRLAWAVDAKAASETYPRVLAAASAALGRDATDADIEMHELYRAIDMGDWRRSYLVERAVDAELARRVASQIENTLAA